MREGLLEFSRFRVVRLLTLVKIVSPADPTTARMEGNLGVQGGCVVGNIKIPLIGGAVGARVGVASVNGTLLASG